jgi:hypothetical protein
MNLKDTATYANALDDLRKALNVEPIQDDPIKRTRGTYGTPETFEDITPEPIQDDIETVRKALKWAFSPSTDTLDIDDALDALDSLVAERDEAREFKLNGMTPEQVFDRFRALEAERDRLVQALERIAAPGSVALDDDRTDAVILIEAIRSRRTIAREALTKTTEEQA